MMILKLISVMRKAFDRLFVHLGCTERTKGVSAISCWYSGLRCCFSRDENRTESCLNHVVGYVLIPKAVVIGN